LIINLETWLVPWCGKLWPSGGVHIGFDCKGWASQNRAPEKGYYRYRTEFKGAHFEAPCYPSGKQQSNASRVPPNPLGTSGSGASKKKCFIESEFVIIGTDRDRKTGAMRALLAKAHGNGLAYAGAAFIALPANEGISCTCAWIVMGPTVLHSPISGKQWRDG
jgi:hypothetical protein